jgi:hypothetical protein
MLRDVAVLSAWVPVEIGDVVDVAGGKVSVVGRVTDSVVDVDSVGDVVVVVDGVVVVVGVVLVEGGVIVAADESGVVVRVVLVEGVAVIADESGVVVPLGKVVVDEVDVVEVVSIVEEVVVADGVVVFMIEVVEVVDRAVVVVSDGEVFDGTGDDNGPARLCPDGAACADCNFEGAPGKDVVEED